MAYCKDCIYLEICEAFGRTVTFPIDDGVCVHFKGADREDRDCYWATEQAFKNGYQAAMDSITRCKGCSHSDTIDCSDGMVWCGRMCRYMKEEGFCSFGERKDNG
jgi:hypothetical protein